MTTLSDQLVISSSGFFIVSRDLRFIRINIVRVWPRQAPLFKTKQNTNVSFLMSTSRSELFHKFLALPFWHSLGECVSTICRLYTFNPCHSPSRKLLLSAFYR